MEAPLSQGDGAQVPAIGVSPSKSRSHSSGVVTRIVQGYIPGVVYAVIGWPAVTNIISLNQDGEVLFDIKIGVTSLIASERLLYGVFASEVACEKRVEIVGMSPTSGAIVWRSGIHHNGPIVIEPSLGLVITQGTATSFSAWFMDTGNVAWQSEDFGIDLSTQQLVVDTSSQIICSDGKQILSAWAAHDGKRLWQRDGFEARASSLVVNPKQGTFFRACNLEIMVGAVKTGETLRMLEIGGEFNVIRLALDVDRDLLFCGTSGVATVSAWEVKSGHKVWESKLCSPDEEKRDMFMCLAVDVTRQLVVAAGKHDKQITVLSAQDGTRRWARAINGIGESPGLHAVHLKEASQTVLAGGGDRRISSWELSSGTQLWQSEPAERGSRARNRSMHLCLLRPRASFSTR